MPFLFCKRVLLNLLLIFLCCAGSARAENIVYLSSLEWPPYVGKYLPGNGESAIVVRRAFAAMGYQLKIIFVPWKRAMHIADRKNQVVGYFPEYYSSKRTEKFFFSDSFSASKLGLLVQKGHRLEWKTADDLAHYKIGIVAGYLNTHELDTAISNGTLKPDYSPHDLSNIMKVIKGRVDGAVIDPFVFQYLSRKDPEVRRMKDKVEISPDIFGVNELYIAFKNDDEGRKYAHIFNEGLKKIRQVDLRNLH